MTGDDMQSGMVPGSGAPEIVAPLMRILEVADPARSVRFYRDVLGFVERSPGKDGHANAVAEMVTGAARVQLVQAVPGTLPVRQVLFLETDDVAAMHAVVRARGGDASERARVNWIKYEVFEVHDPDGHTLWFAGSFNRPGLVTPEPMLEKALPVLPCADVAAAIAHYRDVLGFHINYQQHDLGVMDRDEITLLLVQRGGDRATFGAAEFYVRDANALHAELAARGARVQGEPVSHPWGLRDFQVLDADGNRLTFAQPFE